MEFEQLISLIEEKSLDLQRKALSSVNQLLVIRNWPVGYYILEFEQKGRTGQGMGNAFLKPLTKRIKRKG